MLAKYLLQLYEEQKPAGRTENTIQEHGEDDNERNMLVLYFHRTNVRVYVICLLYYYRIAFALQLIIYTVFELRNSQSCHTRRRMVCY